MSPADVVGGAAVEQRVVRRRPGQHPNGRIKGPPLFHAFPFAVAAQDDGDRGRRVVMQQQGQQKQAVPRRKARRFAGQEGQLPKRGLLQSSSCVSWDRRTKLKAMTALPLGSAPS